MRESFFTPKEKAPDESQAQKEAFDDIEKRFVEFERNYKEKMGRGYNPNFEEDPRESRERWAVNLVEDIQALQKDSGFLRQSVQDILSKLSREVSVNEHRKDLDAKMKKSRPKPSELHPSWSLLDEEVGQEVASSPRALQPPQDAGWHLLNEDTGHSNAQQNYPIDKAEVRLGAGWDLLRDENPFESNERSKEEVERERKKDLKKFLKD